MIVVQFLLFLVMMGIYIHAFFLGKDTSIRNFVRENPLISIGSTLVAVVVLLVLEALDLVPERMREALNTVVGITFFATVVYILVYKSHKEDDSSQNGEH